MKHTKAELRKLNREKKKRFYERHGIKFNKTIRKRQITELNPKTKGEIYAGQNLVYENYKEPLQPIEKGKGHGYYGTIAMTDDGEYIQCHICGNLFAHVGLHLRNHKITSEDYKKKYGLSAGTGLISETTRRGMQDRVFSKIPTKKGGLPVWLQEYNRKVQTGAIKHIGSKRREGGMSLEKRNKLGMCPEQVLEKIRELADILGHTPSEDEFKEHYKYRYYHSIQYQHGSYLKAVKKLGLKSAKELKEPTNEELIECLQDFHKRFKRTPMKSDFDRGLVGYNRQMFWRRFGTLNNARFEAGLNAVLPMPFGKIVELSPDEYLEYRNKRSKS